MNHSHKIEKIIKYNDDNSDMIIYHIMMDCPIQPEKLVVADRYIYEGDEFDPHFSNEIVIARFPPTDNGWRMAVLLVGIKRLINEQKDKRK